MKETHKGIEYTVSETYSNKDMTGWDLSKKKDMDDVVIHGLCLSHEILSECLPKNLKGTTFIACNLDNVVIPDGATVIDCSQRRFAKQEDGLDWNLDEDGNPTSIVNGD